MDDTSTSSVQIFFRRKKIGCQSKILRSRIIRVHPSNPCHPCATVAYLMKLLVMTLKTIIVEDEPLSRAFLNNLLSEFCPAVHVVAVVPTEAEAVEAIERLQPDLVFLDIELQQGTGFEVLKKTQQYKYQVIFTTAFDHYSINAIKFSGVDYLQKPIDFEGLQMVIATIISKQQTGSGEIAVKHLLQTLENNNVPENLVVQAYEGPLYIPVADIIYIEVGDAGCVFNTTTGKIRSTCLAIKEYEQLLVDHQFLRVHHGYIINCSKVDAGSKPESGFITMADKSIIPVSPKKVEELKNVLAASHS
jgi:two-component system, LytTR family, response regulator